MIHRLLGFLLACSLGMSSLALAQPPQQSPFDDLLEGIEPEPELQSKMPSEPAGSADGSPLATAYQAMLQAEQQLNRGDAGEPVKAALAAQQTAIDALDALLQQLQQPQQPPQPQPAGQPPAESQQTESGESEQEASAEAEGEPSGEPQAAPRGGDSPSEDSLTGEANTDPAEVQRSFEQSVWGHLPDRVRQQLQAAMPDEFHPRYQQAITDYFRQLSQPGTAP